MAHLKEWSLEYRNLSEIIPNSSNPRKVSKKALQKLQKQIEEVGFHSPIKLDNNGVILGGNTRYKALTALVNNGYTDIKVPVMIPNFILTERERQEVIITDNVNDGDWDIPALIEDFDMEDLENWGLDDLNISFDDPDMDVVEEEEPTSKEPKMYCCPNCGHINVKKAFEQNNGKGY